MPTVENIWKDTHQITNSCYHQKVRLQSGPGAVEGEPRRQMVPLPMCQGFHGLDPRAS